MDRRRLNPRLTQMALTLVSLPPSLAFARNPLLVKLQSHDGSGALYGATGVKSVTTAASSARFTNAQTFTVAFEEPNGNTTSIVFSAVTSPASETEIPSNLSSGYTNTTYWAKIASVIGAHPRIAPFFTATHSVVSSNSLITIQCREAVSGWEITGSNSAGFTVVNTNTLGADNTPANYRVRAEVFFESHYKSGDFRKVAELESSLDATGLHYFDISGIIEREARHAQAKPPVPTWGTNTPALADNLRRYYVRYTEIYGSPEAYQSWAYSSTLRCVNGGLDQRLHAQGDWLAARDATNCILTWMPDGRRLADDTPEFLAWFNWDSATVTVVLEMKWRHRNSGDWSSPTYFFDASPVAVAPGETLLLPITPDLLGLSAETEAYKFSVRVVDAESGWNEGSGVYLSPARTYFLDRDYHREKRTIQYLNGFGCPETVRCIGERSKRLTIVRELAESILPPAYSVNDSDRRQHQAEGENEITYRTGFLDKIEADVLQELLLENEVYDVSAVGYLPLQITANAFDVTDTFRALHSYAFTAVPRLKMRNYSFQSEIPPLSGSWEAPDGSAWLDNNSQPWEI